MGNGLKCMRDGLKRMRHGLKRIGYGLKRFRVRQVVELAPKVWELVIGPLDLMNLSTPPRMFTDWRKKPFFLLRDYM